MWQTVSDNSVGGEGILVGSLAEGKFSSNQESDTAKQVECDRISSLTHKTCTR